MTTSGTRQFTMDLAEIVEEAYERCGLEVRTGYAVRSARRSINLMLAEWANRGLNMWTVSQGTVSLSSGTGTYTLDDDVVDVLEVNLRRDGTDFELERIGRTEYASQPNKTDTGRPAQFYVDKQVSPSVTLWPVPDNSSDTLEYYYVRRIEDSGNMVNTIGIPFRFYPAMVSGLAYYLAVKRAPDRIQLLKPIYEEEFARAAAEDSDSTSLFLRPARGY